MLGTIHRRRALPTNSNYVPQDKNLSHRLETMKHAKSGRKPLETPMCGDVAEKVVAYMLDGGRDEPADRKRDHGVWPCLVMDKGLVACFPARDVEVLSRLAHA